MKDKGPSTSIAPFRSRSGRSSRSSSVPSSGATVRVTAAAAASARIGHRHFTKDVAPILQRVLRHVPSAGQSAPMSLMTYEEARPWARSIKTRVVNREMPPWHIDRNVGIQKFKDDPSLSDDEIATIVGWVDAGAPRGNTADMPPPRQFADGGGVGDRQARSGRAVPRVHRAGGRAGSSSRRWWRRSASPKIATSRRFRPGR